MSPVATRGERIRRLTSGHFDLVVVGGGINGAGIAREAALRGLRTALVEKGDFASGTSSKSTKLIHGGLRYLEHGDVGLVLESSRERDLLRRRLAPHLVRPLRFFFPVYRDGPVGLWKLRAGLLAYDLLAAFRNIGRHRISSAAGSLDIEPGLRGEGLRGGALYYDCMTDDSRLVIETILAAESAGAVCLNYVGVESFEKSEGRISAVRVRDLDPGGLRFPVRARSVVNATGPWLDRLRVLDDPTAPPLLRPTKGVHLVVPRERVGNRNAVVLFAVRDRRLLFVIPWDEHSIVGTTDTDFDGDPDHVIAEADDVDYLLETVNFHFPRAKLTEADVVSTFAGLRPLIGGPEGAAPSAVSREEEVFESASGLVSLGGGKLTTYRRVAVKVIDHVAARLRTDWGIEAKKDSGTDREPLPGGIGGGEGESAASDDVARFLADRYGGRHRKLLRRIVESPDLGERLSPHSRHLKAEARFAASDELALRVEDVLRRRTQIALRVRDQGAGIADETASLMAGPLGWDGARAGERAEEYRASVSAVSPAEPRRRKA